MPLPLEISASPCILSDEISASSFISGAYMEKATVAPTLRAHVAKEMRAAAEVKMTLKKVRELKGEHPPGKAAGKGKDAQK